MFSPKPVAYLVTYRGFGGHMSWKEQRLFNIEENVNLIKSNEQSICGLSGYVKFLEMDKISQKKLTALKLTVPPIGTQQLIKQPDGRGWYSSKHYD